MVSFYSQVVMMLNGQGILLYLICLEHTPSINTDLFCKWRQETFPVHASCSFGLALTNGCEYDASRAVSWQNDLKPNNKGQAWKIRENKTPDVLISSVTTHPSTLLIGKNTLPSVSGWKSLYCTCLDCTKENSVKSEDIKTKYEIV